MFVSEALLIAWVLTYPLVNELDCASPSITWFSNTFVNTSTGISSKLVALMLVKKASKASLFGANTVKDPSLDKTWSNPVACKADTKVLKLSSCEAISTIEDPWQQVSLPSLLSSQEITKSDNNAIAKIWICFFIIVFKCLNSTLDKRRAKKK